MADLQISQLPALAEADLASGDELAIVDDSASETKRITAKALVEKGVALIDAGSIPGTALASLGSGTVNAAAIATDAVTADKILAGAVGASEIEDGSITATEIAANTLTANEIAPNAIGASELANNAVDTAAIVDAAVTNDKIANATIAYAKLNLSNADIPGAKIADNSITAGQIAPDAVGASELANDAVDTNAIANLAVTTGKLAANSVTASKITDGVITGAKLVDDTLTSTQIAANAITASELADDAVDTNAILDDAVTAAKLAAGAVDTTALGAGAVTGAKIASTTITAANIAAGTITATELAADSVGNSEIAANAVGASELADDAVDTGAIANLAVTNAKIANGTIAYAKLNLSDGDIAGAKLANNSVTANQIAANAVGVSELADNAVDTAAIADDAVTGDKIAATTITGANIAATTITGGKIAANTITASEIAANAIGSSELADNAVDTAAIANTAVTGAKIADTTITAAKLNLANGDIAGAKIADNSLTAQQIAANAIGASELADDAVDTNALADDAVTGAKIAAATITGANIATGTITATQLAADSVGASEIAANAVGASELADDAVDTAAIANLAVTGAKIANATITANKLSLSAGDIDGTKIANDSITASQIAANAITASELADDAVDTAAIANNAVTAAKIAANAVGASELADDAVDTAAVANGAITTAKIADGAVTTAKLSGTIEAATLSDGAVTTAKLADDAVTAAKLGAGAVDTLALGATSVTTAKIAAGAVTDAKVASGISGAKLTDGTVTAAKLLTSDIDRSLNIAAGKLGINNTISAGTSAGISYNAQGLITGATALVASDLPVATATAVGGVSVPTAGGLTVTGAGALSIAATTTGATATKVTFNNFGQVTGTATLGASDLPVGTASAVGAVSVPTGGPLSIDSNGAITVADSGVTAGVGTKVTVDAKGRVTNLATLTSSDLPNHSAALITSGTIPTARIANDGITGAKLANASTTLFGSVAQTGFPTSEFTGQFFFDSVSEDLYIYDGNAYQPVTTLTKGNLVLGGTFNANTSQMASVTTAGAAAGLSVGSNLPTPSSSTDGLYVVVELAGTPSAPAPVVALAPPDYILGVTNTGGSSWEEIDLSQTVAGQVASNITFTPYGQLSSTNVQDALEEVETEKLAKAGGTISGQVLFGHTASLVFEGASADAFETTLGVVDPTTADKTILLPNTSGTLITNNDSGTVTSAMLADGTIVNADINASAAIALTKLEGIAAAKIIVGNGSGVAAQVSVTGDISISDSGVVAITAASIVDADISGSAAIAASKIVAASTSGAGVVQLNDTATSTSTSQAATANALKAVKDALDSTTATAVGALATTGGTLTGDLLIDNAKALKFGEADGDGAHFTSLKAQAQTGDIELVLPASAPSAGQVLKASSGSPTTLEWATDVTNTAAADLTGTTLASNVVASSLTSVGTLTALTVSGTITGDVTGDLTGNADTATALATARSIGGVSFNGTADITLPGVNAAGNQSTTGNAATATKFASAVTIGGVSFDGSANINLPGVNAAGSQDTSGTAALATQFTVTANNATNETVYPLFVDAATGSQGAETDTGFTYNPSTGALTSTSFIGNVTGNLTGNVTGNTSGSAGSCTGNAATATALATARAINGVNFDGTGDITVTAAAGTLSGNTLASGVTASSLTSVGTLGSLNVTNNVVVGGNLTVNGTTTTVSSTTVEVADKNIELGKVASPSDSTADGGGITLDAGSDGDKTWNWVNSTDAWTSSEHIDLSSGKGLKIAGTTVLDASGYTGNAATATKFASSVTIGGVAFDGSANINLPGVNTAGTQDTSGTAALATEFTVTANNSTDETVYPLFADGATGSQGAETDTGLTYNPSTGLLTSTGFSGSGASLTALNASNLGSGTLPDARFPSTLPAASGANLTSLNASNLSSGTVNVARLGSGSSVTTKFLRGDNTWQTISATPEGTAILSTGESGATKFLREDGDGTCSWQAVPSGTTINNNANNRVITGSGTAHTLEGEANLTYDGSGLTIGGSDTTKIILTGANGPGIDFQEGTTQKGLIQWSNAGYMEIWNREDSSRLRIQDELKFTDDGSTWFHVLNAGNIGSGGAIAGAHLHTATYTGAIQTAAQTNITSLGTLTGLTVDGDVIFKAAESSREVTWDKSAGALIFDVNMDIQLTDSNEIRFVNGWSSNGSTDGIYFGAAGSEILTIASYGSTGGSVKSVFDSTAAAGVEIKGTSVNIKHGTTTKIATDTAGVNITGQLDLNGHLNLGDSEFVRLGASQDLTLGHNHSTNINFVESSLSPLVLVTQSDNPVRVQHNGSTKLATVSTGVNITGVLDVDGNVNLSDSHYLQLGDSQDLQLGNNGTNNFIQATGSILQITTASDHAVQIKHNDSTKLATSSTGVAVTGGLTVSGDLTVSGTTTTVNSTTVEVADKNIEIGKVSSPSDTTADGGGLTLLGATNKTWNWVNSTDAWTSSEHIDLASGKVIKVNGTQILSATQYTGNAATATRGDTVAISNDTSNNNRYLTFTTGYSASGLALSIDGSAHLTFNPSTNVLEAGSFVGSGASITNLDADNISSGTLATARIEDDAVTFDKIANVPTSRLIGRVSSGTGSIETLTAGDARTFLNVEDGATADQSASEILTLIKTVDGAGSGLDADTLDGVSSGSFLRGDAADIAYSDISFQGGAGAVSIAGNSDIRLDSGTWTGNTYGKIQHHSNYLYICGGTNGIIFREDAVNRWQIDDNGHFIPGADSSYNIGANGTRVTNVYADNFHGDGSNITNLPASVPSYAGLLKHFCGC